MIVFSGAWPFPLGFDGITAQDGIYVNNFEEEQT